MAVLDALGFKGIWNRTDPAEVLRKFRDTIDAASNYVSEDLIVGPVSAQLHQQRRLLFLSDTIVVASSIEPKDGTEASETMRRGYRYHALLDVCSAVAGLQRWFATSAGEPLLAYRGAIAWGEFTIEESFLIGPATDEAAEAEKLAEAALVWFCPSARACLDEVLSRPLGPGFHPERELPVHRSWHVPMKNGLSYETAVVRPYGATDGLLEGLERAFFAQRPPQPLAVHVKYQNTRAFLLASKERM